MTKLEINLLRPIFIALMTGAVMFAVAMMFNLMAPTWNGQYTVVVAMLAGAEGYFSRQVLRQPFGRASANLRLHLFEALAFFLLLQAGAWLTSSRWFIGDLNNSEPVTISIFIGIFIFLSWHAGYETANDLDQLTRPPAERDELSPEGTLLRRYLGGGVAILITAGIMRVGFVELLRPASDVTPVVVNMLAYFVLGIVFLAHIQYSTLRLRWEQQGRDVGAAMGNRWLRSSVVFLGLVALVVVLLPTSYTSGLLDVLSYGLGLILAAAAYLGALIFYLFGLLISPLANLFQTDQAQPEEPQPQPPPFLPPADSAGGGGDLIEVLKSLLFWAVVLGLTFSMVRTYLWQNKALQAFLARFAPLRLLGTLLNNLWRRITKAGRAMRKRMRQLQQNGAAGKGVTAARRWTQRGSNPMRDEIRGYYLNLLDRAGERGWGRRPPETPHEYNRTLAPHVAEAQDDLAGLTDAFVEASYSQHPPDPERVAAARRQAERLNSSIEAADRAAAANNSKPVSGIDPIAKDK